MSVTQLPELLCPAGEEAALRAAVDCGADAVYLGYKAFGARASAVNFDGEALCRAVRYAHLYHVRVHVTVNTLVKQGELEGVHQALEEIAQAGADAVIVQDLGVAALARERYPSLQLHASTQAALCNAADARFAMAFGFSRVVLARECSLADVRAVAETGVETEVFAHGALCSGVSGRCLLSSMAGGRSGNRGRCAQPCRMGMTLGGQAGALLSLRDLCTFPGLKTLCEAGIRSLKLEGRLKSAEYVAVVTETYRRALDEIAAGTFDPEDPGPLERLSQIFNRGGFTRGHILSAEDAALCCPERVSHQGVPLGRVISVRGALATVQTLRDLEDGDSLQLRDGQDVDLRYSGHHVPAGGQAILRLRPGLKVREGCAVARLGDAKQLEAARRHAPRPIGITMKAAFALNQPMTLTLSDGKSIVTVEGDRVQKAESRAAAEADVHKQLCRLGDTPFHLEKPEDLSVTLAEGLFLPVSALNALRRAGTEALAKARIQAFGPLERGGKGDGGGRETLGALPGGDGRWAEAVAGRTLGGSASKAPSPVNVDTLAVLFSHPELAEDLKARGASLLLYEPCDLRPRQLDETLGLLPQGVWLALPPQTSGDALEGICQAIRNHAHRLCGVMVNSVGQLMLDLGGLPMIAGAGVPVTNRRAMEALCQTPARAFTLWPEWTGAEQRALMPFALPPLLKVYGREVLMLLNHCPERVARGLAQGRATCGICDGRRADVGIGPYDADRGAGVLGDGRSCPDARAMGGDAGRGAGMLGDGRGRLDAQAMGGDASRGAGMLGDGRGRLDAQAVGGDAGRGAGMLGDGCGCPDAQAVGGDAGRGVEMLGDGRGCPDAQAMGGDAGRGAGMLGDGRGRLDAQAMACGRLCPELRDGKGYRFPLRRTIFPEGCVLRLLNALPTDLRAFEGERRALGAGMLLHFTTESREEQLALTRLYAGLARGEGAAPAENVTAGHWRRGVE